MGASAGAWSEVATARLADAGFRRGGARAAVIELLDDQSCALSAYEIEAKLREGGRGAARASVYRALDQLEGLGLLTKIEVGQGIARYEPNRPGSDHHHHMVCARCGDVILFADDELEATLDRVAERRTSDVSEHEIARAGGGGCGAAGAPPAGAGGPTCRPSAWPPPRRSCAAPACRSRRRPARG